MMSGVVAIASLLTLTLASTLAGGTSNYTVSNDTGNDVPQCLWGNSSLPCKTLSYVLTSTPSLNNREVFLLGNHSINQTLTVSHMEGLTIRGGNGTASVVKCEYPSDSNDTGSGLVIYKSCLENIYCDGQPLKLWN